MSNPLEALARRAEREPFFLGWLLAAHARAAGLDDAALANELGCAAGLLADVRLCRAPREDAAGFREDIECIAAGLGLDAERLAAVVQRGRVAARFQSAAPRARLLAARDHDEGQAEE